ncbi:MAG: uracil-DNA glycosylase family protein [Erythrobacter sp.]
MTEQLHREIEACRICAEHLPHGPRPVVQFSAASKILIIGQAPGSKVHASGVAWDDDSGDRLRDWLGLAKPEFYDSDKIALVPMGFCYPGKVPKEKGGGGDKPPRPECAPEWHERVLKTLPQDRLTLLVGSYAQAHYLPATKKLTMTERIRNFSDYAPIIPLPHPAWRVRMWMGKNPWFEDEVLPKLRSAVSNAL